MYNYDIVDCIWSVYKPIILVKNDAELIHPLSLQWLLW